MDVYGAMALEATTAIHMTEAPSERPMVAVLSSALRRLTTLGSMWTTSTTESESESLIF